MTEHVHIWPTSAAYLAMKHPESPVHFFIPAQLGAALHVFRAGFPGRTTYAIKANPDRRVLAQLIAGGIDGFDVASPAEIALIRSLSPTARLHYHNPVRTPAEIAMAAKAGIASWSVDTAGELSKVFAQVDPTTCQIAVRFKLPVAGAAYDFGAKFGASPHEAVHLLRAVADAGAAPALTFHPGTQCQDAGAYATYIEMAAQIARRAAVTLVALNVGGGFPCDPAGGAPQLTAHFAAIRSALSAFETPPELWCEPGRAMVASAFELAAQIKSLRGAAAYLNDGVYGGLSEYRVMNFLRHYQVLTRQGDPRTGPTTPMTIWGPTCDSVDRLPQPLHLPTAMIEGDYIIFAAMGAYVTGLVAEFNGYGRLISAIVQRQTGA